MCFLISLKKEFLASLTIDQCDLINLTHYLRTKIDEIWQGFYRKTTYSKYSVSHNRLLMKQTSGKPNKR